jgi:hypothetical protein
MRDPVARYILGTDAFVSCCIDPHGLPWHWVWSDRSHINARGIVISTATVQLVQHRIRTIAGDPTQQERALTLKHGFETALKIFRDKRCVLPIRDDIASFADERLSHDIHYTRPDGSVVCIGALEKLVIATAICGFNSQSIWLTDFPQPRAFPKLAERCGLQYREFDWQERVLLKG